MMCNTCTTWILKRILSKDLPVECHDFMLSYVKCKGAFIGQTWKCHFKVYQGYFSKIRNQQIHYFEYKFGIREICNHNIIIDLEN